MRKDCGTIEDYFVFKKMSCNSHFSTMVSLISTNIVGQQARFRQCINQVSSFS